MNPTLHVRNRMLFAASLLPSGFLLAEMGAYLFEKLAMVRMPNNVFDACSTWLGRLGWYLGLPFLPLLLDALVLMTFGTLLLVLVRQAYAMVHAKLRMSTKRDSVLSEELDNLFLGGSGSLIIIRSEAPVALTMGFLKPRIVLSTGMLDILSHSELEAVLRHEEFHMRSRDPLRSLLTMTASKVFWYIPILSWLHRMDGISREILADRHAIERTGSMEGLGSALLKLARRPGSMRAASFAHASFAETSLNLRIRHLIEPEAGVPFRMPWKLVWLSALVTVLLTGSLL